MGPPAPRPAYAPPPPPPPPSSGGFHDNDFAWSTASGSGQIIGALSYKGAASRYTCQEVVLTPETPWSRARMRMLYLSTTASAVPVEDVRARTPPETNDYAKYARRAACNAAGHFSFTGLPDGGWYVITVAAPVGGGDRIAVMRRVETNGNTVRVVLR
ncbi:MAG TPA: hypothetical protein VN694_01280 [Caulobacteraceae bacterium]|nr:hypothetical protein [Caulobacteraceae bacterium]